VSRFGAKLNHAPIQVYGVLMWVAVIFERGGTHNTHVTSRQLVVAKRRQGGFWPLCHCDMLFSTGFAVPGHALWRRCRPYRKTSPSGQAKFGVALAYNGRMNAYCFGCGSFRTASSPSRENDLERQSHGSLNRYAQREPMRNSMIFRVHTSSRSMRRPAAKFT